MKILAEVDPITGAQTWVEYHYATDEFTFIEQSDAEPHLEYAKALRNDEAYSKDGIKNGMWHYAHIPNSILDEFYRQGLNPFHRGNFRDVFKKVNQEYPALKTTDGWHMDIRAKKSAPKS